MKKERWEEIDCIRVIAALAVVLIHVSAGYINLEWGAQINQLTRFAVPLFILLAGFGHAPQESTRTSFAKRIKRLLPPYLAWSVLYIALDFVLGKPHPRPLFDILSGSAYIHLYFLFALLQLEVLAAFLARAVARKPIATLAVSALVTLGTQAFLWVYVSQGHSSIWFTRLFPAYLLFYVIGMLLRGQYASIRRASVLRLICAAGLWLASAALVLRVARVFPLVRPMSMRPDLALYTLSTGLLLWQLFLRLRSLRLRRVFGWVSGLSFGLYLSHPFILRLISVSGVLNEKPYALRALVFFTAAVLGGLLISWVLSVLPGGKYLGGKRKVTNWL